MAPQSGSRRNRPTGPTSQPQGLEASRHRAPPTQLEQLLQKMQDKINMQKEIYTNVQKHFALIFEEYSSEGFRSHRELAQSIEGSVLTHLTFLMKGDKLSAPASPADPPPPAADKRAGSAVRAAEPPRAVTTARAETPPRAEAPRANSAAPGPRRSWASVAASPPAAAPLPAPPNRPSPPKPAQQDFRILVRTRQPGLDRTEPYAIRRKVCEIVGTPLESIPSVSPTVTGWAIKPASAQVQRKILDPRVQKKLKELLDATALDIPQTWYNYVI